MNLKSNIRYGWVDRKVCEYACKKWHYSKCCPSGKLYALGFYEDDNFIGTIIFSAGANYNMGKRFAKDHISTDTYIAKDKGKYKYAYPLNKKMRKRLLKECIPYD